MLHQPLISGGILTPKEQLTKQELYQAIHHELVASAKAVKLAHEIMPDSQVGCMILAMPTYPLTPKPEDVLAAMQAEQKNYFFADVQARGAYPKYLDSYLKEQNVRIKTKILTGNYCCLYRNRLLSVHKICTGIHNCWYDRIHQIYELQPLSHTSVLFPHCLHDKLSL
mgnify:FL=1